MVAHVDLRCAIWNVSCHYQRSDGIELLAQCVHGYWQLQIGQMHRMKLRMPRHDKLTLAIVAISSLLDRSGW